MILTFNRYPTLPILKTNFPTLKAIFFDMDGTLFDTEIYHTKAMLKIAKEYDIKPPFSSDKVHAMLVGKADYFVFDIIKDWDGFPKHWEVTHFVNEKNKHFLEIMAGEQGQNYFAEDLALFLQEAKKENLFLSLVTSSEKLVTEKLLKLCTLSDFFDLVLTRDDCPHHKPDPWPYLHAIKTSNCLPHEVIIFEDSKVGLEAAVSSGANVIKAEWY